MVNWSAIGSIILPNIGGATTCFYYSELIAKKDGSQSWYDGLKKPQWALNKHTVGPAWTTVYSSMGYASYLVYNQCDGLTEDAILPLTLYGGQLLMAWAWSPIFFGVKDFKMASIEGSVAAGATAVTAAVFLRYDKTAALLMLPGVAYLAYNAALSYCLWKNNPGKVADEKTN